MTVKLKKAGTMAAKYMPCTINVVLHSDQILEIRDTGVSVLD